METFLTSPLCPFYLKDVFFHVFSLWWIWITLNIWIKLLINSVLPRQGLWSLTACLDALDLVAIHDEFILLTDLHVMLKFAVHGVVPFLNRRNLTKNEIQTHSSHKTILIAMESKSILSVETTGRTTCIHCKQAASFDRQNIPHQWTYQPHPPRPAWFPRGSGRKWPGSIWHSHITGSTRSGKPICCESPAWKTMRPMRPNPLIPIFVASAFLGGEDFRLKTLAPGSFKTSSKHPAICGTLFWSWILGMAEKQTAWVRRRRLKSETKVCLVFPRYTATKVNTINRFGSTDNHGGRRYAL